MSTPEEPIPKKLWGMVHWTAKHHPWIWLLAAVDTIIARDFPMTALFGAIFVVNLFVVSRWDEIGGFWQRRKSMLPYLALGALGILLVGVAFGALWSGGLSTAGNSSTGRIAWNFEQMDTGQANFLNMIRLNQDEIRVVGFGARGKNTSKDPITELRGYVRSDLTNARLPIFVLAQDPTAPAVPNPFQPEMVPTRPEETFGIPGLAEFDIVTYEHAVIMQGVDGIPISQFLREFGSSTLVLEYDGVKIEHQFHREAILKAIEVFERTLNPQKTTMPRVTRRPNASPPVQSALPFQAPVPAISAPAEGHDSAK